MCVHAKICGIGHGLHQAARLEHLQRQMVRVASGLESFRAEILAASDPDVQARIQLKVDQVGLDTQEKCYFDFILV